MPSLAAGLCLTVASVASLAGGERAAADPATLSLQAVDTALEAPAAAAYGSDASGKAVPRQELRARWSPGRQSVGMVAGADWSAAPGNASIRPVLGMRADLSQQTRLVYEVRASAPESPIGTLPDAASVSNTRVALETKPADSPAKRLSGGLFRVQLSGSSTLLLRPRSGGLVVSWRAQF